MKKKWIVCVGGGVHGEGQDIMHTAVAAAVASCSGWAGGELAFLYTRRLYVIRRPSTTGVEGVHGPLMTHIQGGLLKPRIAVVTKVEQ